MYGKPIEEFLALLAEGVSDEAILECAGRLPQDAAFRGALREAWPTSRLPVLGDYFCVERLGHGVSGVVYKALRFDPHPTFIALKVLRFAGEEEQERFLEREVEILKALDCPRVARYLDAGIQAGTHYLAMELVRGVPMEDFFTAQNATLEQRLMVLAKVCDTVADLHDRGVIHRDLAPRHVLVDDQGEPHLVDFGLSAVRTEEWSTQIRRTRTQMGRIMGTVQYMSPEQAWGGIYKTDQRTDIWALGVMLHEIATEGEHPYDLLPLEGKSVADSLLHRIQTETPHKPRIREADWATPLTILISRCLVTEPGRRLASARQLADDIVRCVSHGAIATQPLSLTYRTWRIAKGLMLGGRIPLWSLIICGVVAVMYLAASVLEVSFLAWDQGLSVETQKRLIVDRELRGPLEFRVVGITDETVRKMPALADSLGIAGVTGDVKSWRAVHGLFMRRLARAKPRMVVFDWFFPTQQPGDDQFVEGVLALHVAHIPVVVSTTHYDRQNRPALSPRIRDPLEGIIRHGVVLSRDMVKRPGEYVLAIRRENQIIPSLALSAFGAMLYPQARQEVYWTGREKALSLRRFFGPHDEISGSAIDTLNLCAAVHQMRDQVDLRKGDMVAYRAMPFSPLAWWENRTTECTAMLRADDNALAALVRNRIVLIADLRHEGWLAPADRHTVRYPNGTTNSVPGGYLLGDSVYGLLSRRPYQVFESPLHPDSFAVVVAMALVGCLIAVLLRRKLDTTTKRAAATILTSGLAIACFALLATSQNQVIVEFSMAAGAAATAMLPAMAIENIRFHYQQ